jgi:hypothetical protein
MMRERERDLIRAWTIQSREAWENFSKSGVLRADGRRVSRHHHDSYRWMMEQMRRRLPFYRGRFPVWAWYRPKPDLRGTGFLPPGWQGVRLEFVVPTSRVLFSDFASWHHVLNGWYLPLCRAEAEEWEQASGTGGTAFRQRLLDSWERIFDLPLLERSELTSPVTCVQAVLEEVFLGEVTRVDKFTAR